MNPVRGRRAFTAICCATLACAAALLSAAACGGDVEPVKRVVVLGFDGFDYGLTRSLLEAGRLPHLARLAASGGFGPLATTIPPQSPVAWSSFITGLDPGGHGIFDFVHRDPTTVSPYLSTTHTTGPRWTLPFRGWRFPLSGGTVELLRRGQPFWETLNNHGVETTIVRMPANFPPSGTASRELSGMGTPDLLGTYGTFSFYTSEPYAARRPAPGGGAIYELRVLGGVARAKLFGPNNPLRREAEPLSVDLTLYVDPERSTAKVVVGDHEHVLAVGSWTDWTPVEFDLGLLFQRLRGICRFYLKQVVPDVELYVTPINIDPLDPVLPISHPPDFAAGLAAALGRFYTQGMPEDTQALRAGIFTRDEFLAQAAMVHDEQVRQYRLLLDRFSGGLLFYYFGTVDQVSHMMWRTRDPQHPAYDARTDQKYAGVIDDLYVRMDSIVGETLDRLTTRDTLIVLSDHGFTSWRRSFHLNTWLKENGYLTLLGGASDGATTSFANVDWSRTRAYGVGLNGLYLNVRGREASGIVEPDEREQLLDEIRGKLIQVIDPKTGEPVIKDVYLAARVYSGSEHADRMPDLVVSYAAGVRGSDESALGNIVPGVITDNLSEWSGDHCMDPGAVPGVLFSSRPLRKPASSLADAPAAILAEFGIEQFPLPAGR